MAYNTISFQRSNPLQQMVGLARAMALPHEYESQRFPSFPALERTAVLGFNTPGALAVGASTRIMLTRQASYPLWVDRVSPQVNGYYVDFQTPNPFRLAASSNIVFNSPISFWGTVSRLALGLLPSFQGMLPGFDYPLVAYDSLIDGQEWFYIPASWTGTFILTAQAGALPATDPGLICEVWSWTSPGQSHVAAIFGLIWTAGAQSLAGTFTPAFNGWYRLQRMSSTNQSYVETNASFSMSFAVYNTSVVVTAEPNRTIVLPSGSPISGFLPLSSPPEFVNSVLPYTTTRTTACAALFTNVTKVMNKEGTVTAGRLNPSVLNPFRFLKTDIVGLHPAEKQLLSLETGFYTYCPPSTDLASFWDYTLNTGAGAAASPVYRLDNSALVNCAVFEDPDGGTSLAVNLDVHIEFRSSSALWPIGLSTLTLESFHQAQLSLVAVGFFFPNETHMSLKSRVMPALLKAAQLLYPAVQAFNPAAGAFMRAGSVLINGHKPTIMPTSAKASGIVTKTQAKGSGKKKKKVVVVSGRKSSKKKRK